MPAKQPRKVPAKFKDSVCTPTASQAIEGFDAVMKASKLLIKCQLYKTEQPRLLCHACASWCGATVFFMCGSHR